MWTENKNQPEESSKENKKWNDTAQVVRVGVWGRKEERAWWQAIEGWILQRDKSVADENSNKKVTNVLHCLSARTKGKSRASKRRCTINFVASHTSTTWVALSTALLVSQDRKEKERWKEKEKGKRETDDKVLMKVFSEDLTENVTQESWI